MAGDFNLDDLDRQMQQLRLYARGPDPLSHVLDYFRENRHTTAARLDRILSAMTSEERQNPDKLGPIERQRIASTCGLEPQDIELFLTQFGRLREAMRQVAHLGFWQRLMIVLGRRHLPEAGDT